jgi:PAS domain S-box-containing protein
MATPNPHPSHAPLSVHSFDVALFRTLVEQGTDVIFLIDLETEDCIYVSPAVRLLLGHEPQELIGRALTDFVHPDDAAEVLARSARRRHGRGVRASVTRMSHADGRWVWVQATASPVVSYQGRTTTVFTVAGAAERVRAEVGLRASRLRLRRALAEIGNDHEYLQTQDGSYDLTVDALAAALDLRDDQTGNHTRRVTDLALTLTSVIDPELACDPELRYGFLLHDIGKIGIPDSILLKPGRFNPRELRTLQMHTTLGEHLLSFIPFLSEVANDVVAYHHEHWDGSGYPWGLKGEDIPIAARIFAVADAFDAITNDRVYRQARSIRSAITEIRKDAGTHFDPTVVEAFLPIARQLDKGLPLQRVSPPRNAASTEEIRNLRRRSRNRPIALRNPDA